MRKRLYKKHNLVKEYFLKVSDIHTLNIQEYGNSNGIPIIFLHGGPGGQLNPSVSIYFNPKKYRLILYSQRGCGKSTPQLETRENNIFELVEDIEKIRKHLNIDKFYITGGSFGSTLSLAYAIKYPNNLLGMIIRSIFLGRDEDVRWLYQDGANYYYPDMFEKYYDYVDNDKKNDIVSFYYDKFTKGSQKEKDEASLLWSNWELSLVKLIFDKDILDDKPTKEARELALLECFYFKHHTFLGDDNYILDNCHKLNNLKTWIIHGRYDIDCRPIGAYLLSKKIKGSKLFFVNSGHALSDSEMNKKYFEILENIK